MIYLFRWFNEVVIRAALTILEIMVRSTFALFGGFRGAVVVLGIPDAIASAIAELIVVGILGGIIWLGTRVARHLHSKPRGQRVILTGTVIFWIGCSIGLYIFGLSIYVVFQGVPWVAVKFLFSAAVTYPALGLLVRYIFGRPISN